MATTKKTTNSSFMTELQNMVNGLINDVPSSLRSMNVGGSSMTLPQVLAQMQAMLLLFTNVASARQAFQAAVAAKKAGLVSAHAFYSNVVTNLKQVFGTNQAQLALFGIKPPKAKAQATTTTKAIAAAKRAATRQARGTKGSKQKLAITTAPKATLQVLAPDGTPLIGGAPAPAPAASAAPAAPVAPAAPAVPPPAHGG